MSQYPVNSAPGPPSLHVPWEAKEHVFVQMVCALVKPTIMARKMVRVSRGTDPKRPAEPRRAESRHDREAARAHIVSAACAKGKKRAIVLRKRADRSRKVALPTEICRRCRPMTHKNRHSRLS
jgi:hypothetical protein